METISDFGTVDYFALETLTLGVFNVWLGMNSLSGASQISSVLFIFVVVLLTIEYLARRRQRFFEKSSGQNVLQSDVHGHAGRGDRSYQEGRVGKGEYIPPQDQRFHLGPHAHQGGRGPDKSEITVSKNRERIGSPVYGGGFVRQSTITGGAHGSR